MRILVLANDGEGLYKFRKEVFIELLKENEVYASLPVDKYKEKIEGLGIRFIETEFNPTVLSIFIPTSTTSIPNSDIHSFSVSSSPINSLALQLPDGNFFAFILYLLKIIL